MAFLSVIRADYLQRFRAPRFWMIMLAAAFAAFFMFPGANASYSIMNVYGYRGVYNSAWIGDVLGVVNSLILPLFGFYLIKNAIALDRKSGVDILLKSSPLRNYKYLTGKWLSNFLLLFTLVLIMNFVAILKQFYLGESYYVDLAAQITGQLVLSMPYLLITASLALFFESLPVLRGGIGNMLYVFVWTPMLVFQMQAGLGAGLVVDQMTAMIGEGNRLTDHVTIGGSPIDSPLAKFEWTGFTLDASIWLASLYAIAFAVVLLAVCFLVFRHRFEGIDLTRLIKKAPQVKNEIYGTHTQVTLNPLPAFNRKFGSTQLLRGELRMIFRSHHLLWYGGAALLAVLALTIPIEGVMEVILPATAIWGTLILSQLGCRDSKNHTRVLTGCTIYGESLRLTAAWVSGFALQFILFLGLMGRFYLEGQMDLIPVLALASLFIPALAIFLGRATLTSRTFEFIYILIWYIGPIDHNPALDFLGMTIATSSPPLETFFIASVILLGGTLLLGQTERIKRALA